MLSKALARNTWKVHRPIKQDINLVIGRALSQASYIYQHCETRIVWQEVIFKEGVKQLA